MKDACRILIVEDEWAITMAVRDRLESEGYEIVAASDGGEGFRVGSSGGFDAIVLDVMLPGRDGLTVCRDLRARGVRTPILMLTARDQTSDKVAGLRIGADDYLTKPFAMVELVARIEALLRRSGRTTGHPTTYPIGEYTLDLRRQELHRGSEMVSLSTQEFKLLKYLYEHAGEVLDRDELLSAVWGYDTSTQTRTVDVHIAWLRRKLGDNARQQRIVTVRGQGYKYVPG